MKTEKTSFSYAISRFFKVYLPGERGYSENTIASYRDTFKQYLHYWQQSTGVPPEKMAIGDFSRQAVNGFLEKLEEDGKSAATRNQRLAALKSFFGFVKYEYPEHLETASDILSIRMKKQAEPIVSYMSAEGVACLLRCPTATTKSGYRDMLILTLMYDSGARASEVTQIRAGDIRIPKPATIKLHGKGQKDRIVPLSEKTAELLKSYFEKEKLNRPENKDKFLFINHSGQPLTRAGVAYILKKYVDHAKQEQPNIIPDKFSPHCLRHSKAMHLLQAGVALIYIRDFLGHMSIKTTEMYAKADSKSKRMALEMAYNDVKLPDADLTPSWSEDASLMQFLADLCR